jgi:aspartyl-tRNA(Asn)/glutamyl-tRNA(Gln) amidotransferase subunit A
MDLTTLTLTELAPLLRKRKLSPVELTHAFLKRTQRLNPTLHAFITVNTDRALAAARRAEKEIASGKYRGPLHGIPIALKDNIYTRGVRTTAGSQLLDELSPAKDALIARQLAEAGAILLGKTNLHEFAYGVTTENPHFGAARNPWDTTLIPGGSSGGSAAAIAAGMCCASLGTDTGGSIRIPAAHCGIVGVKTTFDRRSLQGVVPLAESLDAVGPLARTVADAEILLQRTDPLAGRAAQQVRALRKGFLPWPVRAANKRRPLQGVVLGLPKDYFFMWINVEVRRAVEYAIEDCVQLGARVTEVSMPWIESSDAAGTTIALAEAAAWHKAQGWFPQRAGEYGEDVRKRLEMGLEISAAEYHKAKAAQASVRAQAEKLFTELHALVAPATPAVASPVGEKMVNICGREEAVRAALLRLNRPANFAGLPALSVPCGFTKKGLPIGLQLMGPPLGELELCAIARAYEQEHDWHTRRPQV